ncbi:ribonuclease III [Rosettibacter firmus]|uniref:ribonuclease III n=1 Tax=Rosettibacter firmus TaxID=3111522 RepID=UPI00336BF378
MLKKLFKKDNIKVNFNHLINKKALESLLGFKIKNKILYLKALTHSSFIETHPELEKSNERLEFLGDSVLNLVVAHYLFEKYRNEGEGFLTKVRASLVNRNRLYEIAEKLNLKDFLLYNEKYVDKNDEGFKTILADTLEALIGAIFSDRGFNVASEFIIKKIIKPYEKNHEYLIDTNYKGQLLEFTHANKLQTPKYVVISEEGPEHKKVFVVDVYIGNEKMGTGKGKNKKTAEQNASRIALMKLSKNLD